MNVLFYIVLYLFILFLILLLIHFTIHPVFKFTPGSKGYIGIPGTNDSKAYANPRKSVNSAGVTETDKPLPLAVDAIAPYEFVNKFSFSVDLYLDKITDDASFAKRVIMYKARVDASGNSLPIDLSGVTKIGHMDTKMRSSSSMYMFLNEKNDLGFTVYSGTEGTPYSIRQIQNIPLHTPFRVTVVVEEKSVTVYINAQQAFQRVIQSDISLPTTQTTDPITPQRFHFPSWATSMKVHNFILWPRAISYKEVQSAQPALALAGDF